MMFWDTRFNDKEKRKMNSMGEEKPVNENDRPDYVRYKAAVLTFLESSLESTVLSATF